MSTEGGLQVTGAGDLTSLEVHNLRQRLFRDDVPRDVAELVAKLLDHTATLERQIQLMRNGFESACRNLPANVVHDVAPFKKKKP